MSTFIGQLIGFAVIVFILWRYVVPPVRTLMKKQQDAVRAALAESAEAEKKLADADAMHAKALKDAEAESSKVTDEARQDSERIASQLAEQADVGGIEVGGGGDEHAAGCEEVEGPLGEALWVVDVLDERRAEPQARRARPAARAPGCRRRRRQGTSPG